MTFLPCQIAAADEFVKKGGRMWLDAAVGSGKTYAAADCILRSQAEYDLPAFYLTPAYAIKSQVRKLRECGLDAWAVDGTADKRRGRHPPPLHAHLSMKTGQVRNQVRSSRDRCVCSDVLKICP